MRALPTIYKGKEYRSSTEARWHAYFDLIGFEVEHEHDAYCINGRNYLPDFQSKKGAFWGYADKSKQIPWFIEVKGCIDDALDNYQLMQEFSEETQSLVQIVWGKPSCKPFPTWIKGEEVCPSSLTYYGFTQKGWDQPQFNPDEYESDGDSNVLDILRCARRTRKGELLV
jgi:hypothetical protein